VLATQIVKLHIQDWLTD